jgi:predicted class III extradiol MEMO1 family dioxygenase
MLLRIGSALQLKHDPEKWPPVFGQDHAQRTSMTPKSGYRFSGKIMLKEQARARKTGPRFPEKIMLPQ